MVERGFFVTTDLFEVTTPGEHFINPRCFGEDFTAWLRARLIAAGIEASEPIQEDWGWVLHVRQQRCTFTISVGVMDESIGVIPAEWRVGLGYQKILNGTRGWLRAAPIDAVSSVLEQLRAILASEPRFRVSDTEAMREPPIDHGMRKS
jgi:hypothetical protein